MPDAVYQATSMYLLFAIGLKGGVALRASDPAEVLAPIGVALLLGILIPLLAFTVLRYVTRLNPVDRGGNGRPLRIDVPGYVYCSNRVP